MDTRCLPLHLGIQRQPPATAQHPSPAGSLPQPASLRASPPPKRVRHRFNLSIALDAESPLHPTRQHHVMHCEIDISFALCQSTRCVTTMHRTSRPALHAPAAVMTLSLISPPVRPVHSVSTCGRKTIPSGRPIIGVSRNGSVPARRRAHKRPSSVPTANRVQCKSRPDRRSAYVHARQGLRASG
ncbi:hypothetical protein C8Q78DRAFT_531712 [Trametes maxima]|nr:hypothetical protein C8Q78DRAFT_531712 [Trametes maxima]